MDSWLEHAAGSLAMMLPIGAVLAYRTQRSLPQAAAFLGVFVGAWAAGGTVLGEVGRQALGMGNVAVASVVALAGGWQFTARHAGAVRACDVPGGRGWRDGALCARHCAQACGPLMVAMAVAGLHTTTLMIGFGGVLVAQFARPTRAVSWFLGSMLAVAAVAFLFLGHGPLSWPVMAPHSHSAHTP